MRSRIVGIVAIKNIAEFYAYITGTEKLINWFGYWPSFHDAEVRWIKMQRGNDREQGDTYIEFVVHAWEANFNIRKGMPFPKQSLVHFLFRNCADIHFADFNNQNQLNTIELSVEQQIPFFENTNIVSTKAVVKRVNNEISLPQKVLKVVLISEYGVKGKFLCSSGEIVSVTPCNEDGIPLES